MFDEALMAREAAAIHVASIRAEAEREEASKDAHAPFEATRLAGRQLRAQGAG